MPDFAEQQVCVPHVSPANGTELVRICCRLVLLGLIALARLCHFVYEQPSSSLMPLLPYFQFLALIIRPLAWNTVHLPLGSIGVC